MTEMNREGPECPCFLGRTIDKGIYSFIHLLIKYLVCPCLVPGSVLSL